MPTCYVFSLVGVYTLLAREVNACYYLRMNIRVVVLYNTSYVLWEFELPIVTVEYGTYTRYVQENHGTD